MNSYMVFVSLAKPNKATANKIISNLNAVTSETVAPAWIDSAYIGIPISTDTSAREIWRAAVAGINETSDLRDLLVIELGRDWLARTDTRTAHWLKSHLGHPLPK